MKVLLKGVVGSTAYGLAHAGSDIDYLGVFASPTEDILGLRPPEESVVTKDPDTTLHEAKKFVTLALRGNPSVSELLWLDSYEHIDPMGDELVNLRRAFLSAPRVRDAYMGYASSQFSRLLNRGDGSFSADTRKRNGESGTLAHHEDMQSLQEGEAQGSVRREPPNPGWPGESLRDMHQGTSQGGVRPESGVISRVGETPQGESNLGPRGAILGHAECASPSTSSSDVRSDPRGGRRTPEGAGGRVSDLRGNSGSGRPLPHHWEGPGGLVSQVQSGAGAFRGQRDTAGTRLGVPGGKPGEVSPEWHRRARLEKHARHLVRLVEQGFYLYVTGELVVNLHSNASEVSPDWVHKMGEEIANEPDVATEYMAKAKTRFDAAKTCLPDKPDEDAVNRWLIRMRRHGWRSPSGVL